MKIFLATIGLLVMPCAAYAEGQTTWDFRGGNLPGKWSIQNLSDTPELTNEGLRIRTGTSGEIARPTELPHGIDIITLTYMSSTDTEVMLLWNQKGASHTSGMPVALRTTDKPITTPIVVRRYRNAWNPETETIGLRFLPGADVTIVNINFGALTPAEKLSEAWKSMWSLSPYKGHNINFMWGPRIAFDPVSTIYLHTDPPPAASANVIFYLLAVLLLMSLMVLKCTGRIPARSVAAVFLVFTAASWLLYDLRMGVELLGYMHSDYQNYISQPKDERVFRTWGPYTAMLESLHDFTQGKSHYVLISDDNTSKKLFRYHSYPALPVEPEDAEQTDTWVVFRHPNAVVDHDGQLLIDGNVVAQNGSIERRFNEYTFFYRIQ